VEDITSKTGNFKKFPIFVRMLHTALQQDSDSCFIDLLTYQDLEVLKAKKAAAANTNNNNNMRQLPPSNKRYLILTYLSEFDRVHYPLPLLQDDAPDPERLKAAIRELRQQLAHSRHLAQHQQQQHQQQGGLAAVNGTSSSGGQGEAELAHLLQLVRRGCGGDMVQEHMWEQEEGGHPGSDFGNTTTTTTTSIWFPHLNSTHHCPLLPPFQPTPFPPSFLPPTDAPPSPPPGSQARAERDQLVGQVEGLAAQLDSERGLHRRETKRRQKDLATVSGGGLWGERRRGGLEWKRGTGGVGGCTPAEQAGLQKDLAILRKARSSWRGGGADGREGGQRWGVFVSCWEVVG
jgi:hypothetical protein